MRIFNVIGTAVLCMGLSPTFAENAVDGVALELHRDPFVSPEDRLAAETPEEGNNVTIENSSALPETTRTQFLWQPEIRGIIRSEDIAIVNIGGKMVGLGEEIDGYTLIKVKEKAVVFEKNGHTIPITYNDDPDALEQAL